MLITETQTIDAKELPKKLSVSECRQILKRPDLSDREVEKIRDMFYMFSAGLVEAYQKDSGAVC